MPIDLLKNHNNTSKYPAYPPHISHPQPESRHQARDQPPGIRRHDAQPSLYPPVDSHRHDQRQPQRPVYPYAKQKEDDRRRVPQVAPEASRADGHPPPRHHKAPLRYPVAAHHPKHEVPAGHFHLCPQLMHSLCLS